MNRRKVVFVTCLFFVFGIFITSIFFENLNNFHFIIFVCFLGSLVLTFFFYPRKIFIASLWGAFLFLGVWRVLIAVPENTPDKIWHYNDNKISFIGEIMKESDVRASNQKLTVNVITMNDRGVSGRVLVTTGVYPEYEYGDILEIKCKLKKPERFEDFAYDKYLARYNIYSVCGFAQINKLDNKNSLFRVIFRIKRKIGRIINNGLPEPQSSLANAMILGYKRGIDNDLRDSFSKIGISHIIAISGMHISIMVAVLFGFFLNLGLKRRHVFYIISLFLIFYVMLIGLPASAVRASLMGFLVLLAMHVGRLNRLDYALVLVAFILLLINPKQLIADVGFQLSFLAVFGIAYIYPVFDSFYNELKETIAIKRLSNDVAISSLLKLRNYFISFVATKSFKIFYDILAITLSAWISTLPIIVYNFKVISFISPISNLLVLWTLPFILISIFIVIPFCAILPNLSVLFFLPTNMLLKYVVFIADFLASIPFAFFSW